MFQRLIKDRNLLTIVISIILVCVIYICSSFFYVFNKNIQNKYYTVKNAISGTSANSHIIVGTIDNKTLEKLGRFPFDRSVYAQVLDNLSEYDVATTAFDLIFIDDSDEASDKAFSESIKESGNVVLGSAISADNKIEEPNVKFKNTAFFTWYLPPNIDSRNRTVYSFSPTRNLWWRDYEHFAFRALRAFYMNLYQRDYVRDIWWFRWNYYELIENIRIPVSNFDRKDVLINYVKPTDFEQISFVDLYDAWSLAEIDKEIDLQDKIILIGTTADAIKDIFYTPNGIEDWVFIHANIMNTVLTKRYLVYFDRWLEWTLIFLLVVLSVYFNLSKSNIVSIFSNIYIASEILSWEWKVNLDGEKKEVVVFFSDIKNFTGISERLTPEKLVFFLREYLTKMSNIIMDERWFIDKYEWDSVMALWGVFGKVETWDYFSACKSAIAQKQALITLSDELSDMIPQKISIRMWIHAWEVIVWNIWAKGRKMEFTALWDNVNLASRLEWVNKLYGTDILASGTVYHKMKNDFTFRFIDTIRVKWKELSVNIYELICEKDKTSEHRKQIITDFWKAIELYKQWNFLWALESFSILSDTWDGPSLTYKKRCEEYIKNPPGNSWDGVWTMISK